MLHYRHNNFYAPVTPSETDQRQRKQIINKERDTTAIMLYLLKKETKTTKKKKRWDNTHPLILINHPPIIQNNYTMDTEFLVQMRQSNKCGSVRGYEIFNLRLGSGVGRWASIPCLLQDMSHIYWFHPYKKLTIKKQRTQKWGSTPNKSYCTALVFVDRNQD